MARNFYEECNGSLLIYYDNCFEITDYSLLTIMKYMSYGKYSGSLSVQLRDNISMFNLAVGRKDRDLFKTFGISDELKEKVYKELYRDIYNPTKIMGRNTRRFTKFVNKLPLFMQTGGLKKVTVVVNPEDKRAINVLGNVFKDFEDRFDIIEPKDVETYVKRNDYNCIMTTNVDKIKYLDSKFKGLFFAVPSYAYLLDDNENIIKTKDNLELINDTGKNTVYMLSDFI